MTDTSALVPNSVGITSDLQFNLKDSAVRSRSYRASIAPTNKSTFNPADTCIMYIPGGRRNTYLDPQQSYIRYTIKNNDTTSSIAGTDAGQAQFYLDNNGACVINRLDVFHASNLLESIQSYNQLMTIMLDTNINAAQKLGLSAAYGTSATTATTDISRKGAQLFGTFWTTAATPATSTSNGLLTICMPVISGVFGLGSDKMLPIGKLNDDIRLEFTFEQNNTAVVYNALTPSAGWTITDVQLELAIVELSDEGESMVNSVISPTHPIYLHGNSYRHYSSPLAAAAGGVSVLVPARFGSLKSLFVCPRRSTEITDLKSYSLSSRINPNFAQYWWRIGSALIPAKYVTLENTNTTGGYAESFLELQRVFHSVSTPANASVLPLQVYNVGDQSGSATLTGALAKSANVFPISTAASSYLNGFLIGQEMESFANRSDILLSGYNTLSQQIFFEAQINTAPSAAYTLNIFANYDHILILDQGILSVRF